MAVLLTVLPVKPCVSVGGGCPESRRGGRLYRGWGTRSEPLEEGWSGVSEPGRGVEGRHTHVSHC